MTTDNKTLADVQPGGRVRLGDSRSTRAATFLRQYLTYLRSSPRQGLRPRWCDVYEALGIAIEALSAQPSPGGQGDALKALDDLAAFCSDDTATVDRHVAVIRAALSAQPSPGGQDALDCIGRIEEAIEFRVPHDIYAAVHGELAELQAALAARQPVGEPVPLVVPGAPTRCRHCESADLEWFAHVRAVNDVPHGRLTTHDVGCVFVLGCNECSETLHTVKANSIAALLAAPPAQAVDLAMVERAMLAHVGKHATRYVLDDLRALIDSQAVGK